MYIDEIVIENFRTIGEKGVSLRCNPGINIIIGENNSGKTAIIDALRLAFSAGIYRKNLYVKPSDFHINRFGEQASKIYIDIYFSGLTEEQGIAFYLMTDGNNTTTAELHIEYSLYQDKKGNIKVNETIKGGPAENSVPREVWDNINLLYLEPLRDAENAFKSSRHSQLARILLSSITTDKEKEEILIAFNSANDNARTNPTICGIETLINKNLLNIEQEELHQGIQISLAEPSIEGIAATLGASYKSSMILEMSIANFEKILTDLSIELEAIKRKKFYKKNVKEKTLMINLDELAKFKELKTLYDKLSEGNGIINHDIPIPQMGLGYNNILHMACSLGDLQKKPVEEEISVLLVEEPEAHLHPQLLELLFNFFKKTNEEAKFQVFMTSHSPTMLSRADLDSIHILQSGSIDNKIVSLKSSALNAEEKLDLKRYLDVTKSQLFFAKRVVFVEGISEAILLSELAKLHKKPFDKYAVEIVNINGVAFGCFAKLFNENVENNFLSYPCAIISDDDRCTNEDDPFRITKKERVYGNIDIDKLIEKFEHGTMSHRARKLKNFHNENVWISLAEKTFEYELAKLDENVDLILEVLKKEHSKIARDIEAKRATENSEKIAIRIWIALQDCKGSFAQKLANEVNKIASGERNDINFVIPDYIKKAIDFIIK